MRAGNSFNSQGTLNFVSEFITNINRIHEGEPRVSLFFEVNSLAKFCVQKDLKLLHLRFDFFYFSCHSCESLTNLLLVSFKSLQRLRQR